MCDAWKALDGIACVHASPAASGDHRHGSAATAAARGTSIGLSRCARAWLATRAQLLPRARDAGYSLPRPPARVARRPGDVFGARRVRAGGGVGALPRIDGHLWRCAPALQVVVVSTGCIAAVVRPRRMCA